MQKLFARKVSRTSSCQVTSGLISGLFFFFFCDLDSAGISASGFFPLVFTVPAFK